jgi:hypothetical protein
VQYRSLTVVKRFVAHTKVFLPAQFIRVHLSRFAPQGRTREEKSFFWCSNSKLVRIRAPHYGESSVFCEISTPRNNWSLASSLEIPNLN